jgi:hypothetical protein
LQTRARAHFCRMLSLVVDYLRYPKIHSDQKLQPNLLCRSISQSVTPTSTMFSPRLDLDANLPVTCLPPECEGKLVVCAQGLRSAVMEKRVKTEKDRSIPCVRLAVLEAHPGTEQPYAVASIGVHILVALYVATTHPAAEDVGGHAELTAANEVWGEYNLPKARKSTVTIHVTHRALQRELRSVDVRHTKTEY